MVATFGNRDDKLDDEPEKLPVATRIREDSDSEGHINVRRLGYLKPPPGKTFYEAHSDWAEAARALGVGVSVAPPPSDVPHRSSRSRARMSAAPASQDAEYYQVPSRARSTSVPQQQGRNSVSADARPPQSPTSLRAERTKEPAAPSKATVVPAGVANKQAPAGTLDSVGSASIPIPSENPLLLRVLARATAFSGAVAAHGWDLRLKTNRRIFWSHLLLLPFTVAIILIEVVLPSNPCGVVSLSDFRRGGDSDWEPALCRPRHARLILVAAAFILLGHLAPIGISALTGGEVARRVTPYCAAVTHVSLAAAALAYRGTNWFTHTPDEWLALRLRDTIVYPAFMAGAMQTGIQVPRFLELGTLLVQGVLHSVSHIMYVNFMKGDTFQALHGSPEVGPSHYALALCYVLFGWAIYLFVSLSLWGSLASSPLASVDGPRHQLRRQDASLAGLMHLIGWGVWLLVVGLLGIVVIAGSRSIPWLSVDIMSVLALVFALLNVAIVRISSSLALGARDRVIQQLLPPDASKALLDQIAVADKGSFRRSDASQGFRRRWRSQDIKTSLREHGHQLEVASAHEGGPAQVEGRTRRQGSKMSRFWRMSEAGYVVDGSQKPRLGQLGNVAEAREREMLFCKRMEHLTVVGLELPTLKKSGKVHGGEHAAQLIHELHCVVEEIIAGQPGVSKVDPVGVPAVIVVALNLQNDVANHEGLGIELGQKLHAATMSLVAWQDSNLSPACKVAVASGPAVTALLGRSYPVMSLLGETLAEVQGLLDSTPSGWITISQGTYDGARRPLPVKFIGSEIYSKGQGITAVFQADLLGEPTHSRTHGAETSTPRTGLGGDGRTPVEAMSGV